MKLYLSNIDDVARGMIGIPHKHLGRDPKVGLDCLGMAKEFYRRLGLPVREVVEGEDSYLAAMELVSDNRDSFQRVQNYYAGGVLLLKMGGTFVPNHLGIVLDNTFMLDIEDRIGIHKIRLSIKSSLVHLAYKHKDIEILDPSYREVRPAYI